MSFFDRTVILRFTDNVALSIKAPQLIGIVAGVIVFTVNPSAHIAKNALMIETGRVSPVMTVERQEFRNR